MNDLEGRWPEVLKKMAWAVLLLFPALVLTVSSSPAVQISDLPLETQIAAPPPLVMFIWDDSDSMDREFMTPETYGLFSHRYYLFPDEAYTPAPDHNDGLHRDLGAAQRPLWRSQWYGYNRIYFNPERRYAPWPDAARFTFEAADPDRPFSDPMRTASSDARLLLSAEFFSIRSGSERITVPNAHYFIVADDNGNLVQDPGEAVYLITWQDADMDQRLDRSGHLEDDRRRYFRFDDDGDGLVEDDELTSIISESEKHRLRPAAPDAQGQGQSVQTDAEALQNFANWFTYHRRRETAAKAVVAGAITDARQCFIGLYTVNGDTRLGVRPVQVVAPPETAESGGAAVRLDESEILLDALYRIDSRGQSNLRQALDQVGRYFHQSKNSALGPAPWFSAEQGGACQRSYAVLLSDGFWNGLFAGVGNADGNQGAPYADRWSDTLADVAMHYYLNDLAPGLEDSVPAQGCDMAAHQHLVTHVLSFGVNGTIDRRDIDANSRPDKPGYGDDPCFALPETPHPSWPLPVPGVVTTADDLWHAAVNGRGLYLHADEPAALKTAMDRILEAIGTAVSSSGLAVGGTAADDAVVYQALYRSDDWSGEVLAFALGTDGRVDNRPENALWKAAPQLQPSETLHDQRRILTYGGPWREPQGVPFRYDALSASQKQILGAGLANEEQARELLDFLRGREFPHLRRRSTLMGDVVHATPVLSGRTLFVGANDGMLHALDSQTGAERFAYVPSLLFDHLGALASPEYASRHRFYVDGPPYVGEVLVGPYQRCSYLVAGLGKGARGCYGLLVESRQREAKGAGYGDYQIRFSLDDIGDGTAEPSLASIILWEYPRPEPAQDNMDNDGDGLLDEDGEGDDAIGYILGQVYAVNANAARDNHRAVVIFGNGYNSDGGRAVLFVLDAASGRLVRKIDTGAGEDNGLSVPALIDVDLDRRVDYGYAGDLKGNLWKFDLTATDPAHWGVAYGEDLDGDGVIDAAAGDRPLPLFAAPGQSITGRPDVMAMAGACAPGGAGYMVIFGTGCYLGLNDRYDLSLQSVYGIWDFGDDGDDSEHLGAIVDRTSGLLSSGLVLAPRQVAAHLFLEGGHYRQLNEWRVDYAAIEDPGDGDGRGANNGGGRQAPDPKQWAGWFFDFPKAPDPNALPGERVSSQVVIRDGRAVVLSFAPNQAPCDHGGVSWRYLLNGCGNSPDPAEGADPKQLSRRFDGRLNDAMLILKNLSEPHLDRFLYSDHTGRIVEEAIEGELWGRVYWRQNAGP
jgi:hypothetical protein